MLRRLAAVAAAAVVLSGLTAAAAPARPGTSCWPDQPRVWRIRRQGSAPRVLDASIDARSLGTRSTVMVATGAVRAGRWHSTGTGLYSELGNRTWSAVAYPLYVYGGDTAPVATPARPAAAPQACEAADAPHTIPIPRTKPTGNDWFVAAIAADITISVKSPGWTVTELTPGSGGTNFRVYRNDDGAGAGAATEMPLHVGVEHFQGVTAVGGRYGSVAVAHLPCDPMAAFAPDPTGAQTIGWGAATLLGGTDVTAGANLGDRYMTCQNSDTLGVDVATGPTTWRVYGEAVGASAALNRLMIFDFPKP